MAILCEASRDDSRVQGWMENESINHFVDTDIHSVDSLVADCWSSVEVALVDEELAATLVVLAELDEVAVVAFVPAAAEVDTAFAVLEEVDVALFVFPSVPTIAVFTKFVMMPKTLLNASA